VECDQCGHIFKSLDSFNMIRMGMGAYDQSDILKGQVQFHKPLLHMTEQVPVAGIDENTGGTVD